MKKKKKILLFSLIGTGVTAVSAIAGYIVGKKKTTKAFSNLFDEMSEKYFKIWDETTDNEMKMSNMSDSDPGNKDLKEASKQLSETALEYWAKQNAIEELKTHL